jgi:hypothetical protein
VAAWFSGIVSGCGDVGREIESRQGIRWLLSKKKSSKFVVINIMQYVKYVYVKSYLNLKHLRQGKLVSMYASLSLSKGRLYRHERSACAKTGFRTRDSRIRKPRIVPLRDAALVVDEERPAVGVDTLLPTWGQCYDYNFQGGQCYDYNFLGGQCCDYQISAIFDKFLRKNWHFSQKTILWSKCCLI